MSQIISHNDAFSPSSLTIIHGPVAEEVFAELNEDAVVVLPEGRLDPGDLGRKVAACNERGIWPVIVADNTVGFLLFRGWVKEIWMAAEDCDGDAVTASGGVTLAVLARHHEVVLRLVAPCRPFVRQPGRPDLVTHFAGHGIVPETVRTMVPLIENIPQSILSTSASAAALETTS